MSQKTSTNLQKFVELKTDDLRGSEEENDRVDARHNGVAGFCQDKFSNSTVLLVGAGGLNGEISEGLVRKGIGKLTIFDGDTVALSNLNRQRFYKNDIGKNKAIRLAHNLQKEGTMGTEIYGYPLFVQEFIENDNK